MKIFILQENSMNKSVKFAVSIPDDEFKDLEALRRINHLTRSKFIREAIQVWKKEKELQKLIRLYEEGYKRMPEDPSHIEPWEKASLSVFSQEEW